MAFCSLSYTDPIVGTNAPDSAFGACSIGSRSPWPQAFAPPTPRLLAQTCSPTSSLLCRSLTSPVRASLASAPRLPNAGRLTCVNAASREISRLPYKALTDMPVSRTTLDCTGTRESAPLHAVFRRMKSVNVQIQGSFAAQWLAYRHPCQRFALRIQPWRRLGLFQIAVLATVETANKILCAQPILFGV